MVRAKIVGAGGYGGIGISELLTNHPQAEIAALIDIESAGQRISDIYPHLDGFIDDVILDPSAPQAQAPADVVFMATPDGVGMKLAVGEIEKGGKVIDYSGDFRFNTTAAYRDYASRIGINPEHAAPDLLTQAVYGLPELHRDSLSASSKIIGNPGCFAVSCILGLAPAVSAELIDLSSIICDCKTGVSGAGRKPSAVFHYPARYEQMNAYRLSGHQHVCEIERELSLLASSDVRVTFTAQVVPTTRGIMSTLYANAEAGQTPESILEAYRDFYAGEPFVRVYPPDAAVGTHHVRGTNKINLVASLDTRTGRMRVVSYIDNLMKGQAGSAMQNMNILFGLPETMGLDRPGLYP